MRVLHEMAERCDYGAQKNELIRDSLGLEISDMALSKKLQIKGKLTLEMVTLMVRQAEEVGRQISEQKAWTGGATSMSCKSDIVECTEEVAKKWQKIGAREPRGREDWQ